MQSFNPDPANCNDLPVTSALPLNPFEEALRRFDALQYRAGTPDGTPSEHDRQATEARRSAFLVVLRFMRDNPQEGRALVQAEMRYRNKRKLQDAAPLPTDGEQ